jgi:hypothetical protein
LHKIGKSKSSHLKVKENYLNKNEQMDKGNKWFRVDQFDLQKFDQIFMINDRQINYSSQLNTIQKSIAKTELMTF